jgi:hypothetical protein
MIVYILFAVAITIATGLLFWQLLKTEKRGYRLQS